jgi:hypothetical protein
MPRYELTVYKHQAAEILQDVCSMNLFPIEVRERLTSDKDLTISQISAISLTLTEEEYVFLSLKYSMIHSKEITAVDVVGKLING